jgi:hypothetical protein
MSNDDKQSTDTLNQLKNGAILIKRKADGKKFSRRFFLRQQEDFISYENSQKLFGKPRICK